MEVLFMNEITNKSMNKLILCNFIVKKENNKISDNHI
jgi:hypothetical protein